MQFLLPTLSAITTFSESHGPPIGCVMNEEFIDGNGKQADNYHLQRLEQKKMVAEDDLNDVVNEGLNRLGLSDAAIGRLFGVSRQSIFQWRRYRSIPRHFQRAFAEITGVSLELQARLDEQLNGIEYESFVADLKANLTEARGAAWGWWLERLDLESGTWKVAEAELQSGGLELLRNRVKACPDFLRLRNISQVR